jgi:DNA-binding transcriptional LysR family regulator
MQLKHLRTFVAVAGTLNLTRAAAKLHLAQSSVTEQIQALENDLGMALFDRSRRRLTLTVAGTRLLDYAGSLLALNDEARAAVACANSTISGRVVIGGIDSLCLKLIPELLLKYCSDFPDVQVVLRSGKTTDLHGSLKAGLLDVYFTFGAAVEEKGLQSESVGSEPIVLIAPSNHRLVEKRRIALDEFAKEPFLVTVMGCPVREAFERAFASQADRPRIVGEFTSIAAMRSLVEAGAGCAFVPRTAALDALANGKVVALVSPAEQSAAVTMKWRRQRSPSSALHHFLEVARRNAIAA